MTNTIKIAEKDILFSIAKESGWVMKLGTQVTIDGIDFDTTKLEAQNDKTNHHQRSKQFASQKKQRIE
ncbi:hypothetical protein DXP71_14880 [Listeria monocytogenes serotype 4b]|nr:hypothetical protein [Listeria monocytogenes serotype 4b]